MASLWFQTFCFSLFTLIISSSSSLMAVSYNDHCSSIAPESNPTIPINKRSMPYLSTPYVSGGDSLLHRNLSNQTYYFDGKFLKLLISPDYYQTNATAIYKVHGFLKIGLPFTYNDASHSDAIKFSMNGFWSENSRKLCMVGSASWEAERGEFIDLDAVLKLSYATHNDPTIYSSVATGILESAGSSNDPSYFDPISIFSFPLLPNYRYSLVGGSFPDDVLHDLRNEPLNLSRDKFCSAFGAGLTVVELEYATQCSRKLRHCSPLHRFLPRMLFLRPIQCSAEEGKFRYTAKFHNMSQDFCNFSPESTLVGEASWDDEKQQLFGVLCRLLSPWTHFGNAVKDCSMRLRLWYPSVFTIRNEAKISGQLWTTKAVEESGYFRKIKLSSAYENGVVSFRERRYEYTELDRARESCPPLEKKLVKKGEKYPDANSHDMRFDVSIKSSKGEHLSWGYASPIAVENDTVNVVWAEAPESSDIEQVGVSQPQHRTNSSASSISYRIMLNPFPDVKVNATRWFPSLNESLALHQREEIMAEGVYNAETGELCMVGCRKLVVDSTYFTKECEILVQLEFPPLKKKRGGFIKGTIGSTRAKQDPLYFDDLILQSPAYYGEVAEESQQDAHARVHLRVDTD